jgi:hypothetical protein
MRSPHVPQAVRDHCGLELALGVRCPYEPLGCPHRHDLAVARWMARALIHQLAVAFDSPAHQWARDRMARPGFLPSHQLHDEAAYLAALAQTPAHARFAATKVTPSAADLVSHDRELRAKRRRRRSVAAAAVAGGSVTESAAGGEPPAVVAPSSSSSAAAAAADEATSVIGGVPPLSLPPPQHAPPQSAPAAVASFRAVGVKHPRSSDGGSGGSGRVYAPVPFGSGGLSAPAYSGPPVAGEAAPALAAAPQLPPQTQLRSQLQLELPPLPPLPPETAAASGAHNAHGSALLSTVPPVAGAGTNAAPPSHTAADAAAAAAAAAEVAAAAAAFTTGPDGTRSGLDTREYMWGVPPPPSWEPPEVQLIYSWHGAAAAAAPRGGYGGTHGCKR